MKRFLRFVRVSPGSVLPWLGSLVVLGMFGGWLILLVAAPVLLVVIESINRRRQRREEPSEPSSWPNAAVQTLLPLYLARAYLVPLVFVSMFFPWALETSKPLLAAGRASLKTGWEFQGMWLLVQDMRGDDACPGKE